MVEMNPMDLGYIFEVKLAGLVERLDGEDRVRMGGMRERKISTIMPKL